MSFTVNNIKAIQTKLKSLGYYNRAIDGLFGPYTQVAVKVFQQRKGLLVDGIVGPVTAKALGLTSVLFPTTTPTVTNELGYFINRIWNPLQNISWTGLKAKGINAVYIRCAEENLEAISTYLPAIKAAGLKPYAWTWQGFTRTQDAVNKGWHICADIERNRNLEDLPEIKAINNICKASNKTFILCTKAQDTWDGDQHWSEIIPYCTYIMPMLYLGDYNKTLTQLKDYMIKYNKLYPGKVYPALETYVSDANPVPKSLAALQAEIAAVKPYCKGIGLFRYGITPL
jgi:hypothetical protein